MKTTDFFQRFHEVLQGHGFTFFFDVATFEAPQQMSANRQLLVQSLAYLARLSVGVPLALGTPSLYERHGRGILIEDLKNMQRHCDLICLKDSFGKCSMRLAISADEVPDESLVGRLAIIHEQAQNFQKYAADINPLKARPWVKKLMGVPEGGHVWCGVFLIFSSHQKGKEFFERHVAKSKHGGFWKHTHTHPYVVDLEYEFIRNSSGKELENLSADVFRGQKVSTVRDTW